CPASEMEFLLVSHKPGSDPERDLQRPDLSEVAKIDRQAGLTRFRVKGCFQLTPRRAPFVFRMRWTMNRSGPNVGQASRLSSERESARGLTGLRSASPPGRRDAWRDACPTLRF